MDHVSTFARSVTNAVSEIDRGRVERARGGLAVEVVASDGRAIGACDPAYRSDARGTAGPSEGQRKTGPSPCLARRDHWPGRRHHHARTGCCPVRCDRCPRPFGCHRAVPAQARVHAQIKSLVAAERHRAKARQQRDAWFNHRVPAVSARPERGVLIDETSVKTDLTRQRGAECWFPFPPPYGPGLNPIGMAFSKLKAHLRRTGARTFTDMFDALAEICDLDSPDECWNYFKAAGYVSR